MGRGCGFKDPRDVPWETKDGSILQLIIPVSLFSGVPIPQAQHDFLSVPLAIFPGTMCGETPTTPKRLRYVCL